MKKTVARKPRVKKVEPIRVADPREVQRKMFHEKCANHPQWTYVHDERKEEIVRRMERSCITEASNQCKDNIVPSFEDDKFTGYYSNICYRVISNCDPTSSVASEYLLDQIIIGNIDENKVAQLTSCELCPNASRDVREEIDIRSQQKVEPKTSSKYTCKKCGCKETTVHEYQSKGGDESSTLSIMCQNVACGFTWRIS